MTSTLSAALTDLGFSLEPGTGVLGFEAAGELLDAVGGVVGDVAAGLGITPDPARLLVDVGTIAAGEFWMATGMGAVLQNGAPDRPVWAIVFGQQDTRVYGWQAIDFQSPLRAPGLLDFAPRGILRVALVVRGGTITAADMSVTIRATLRADLGPVGCTNAQGSATLRVHVDPRANVAGMVKQPEEIFARDFVADLTLQMDATSRLKLLGSDLGLAQKMTLTATLQGKGGESDVELTQLTYEHESPGLVAIGGAFSLHIEQLKMLLAYERLSDGSTHTIVSGSGRMKLDAAATPVFPNATSGLDGAFSIETESGSFQQVEARINQFVVAPAANPLALSGDDFRFVWRQEAGRDWTFRASGEVQLSWATLARRLAQSNVVGLPVLPGEPMVDCSFAVSFANVIALRLDVLLAGRQQIVGVPLVLRDSSFTFSAAEASGQWAWSASASGKLTTLAPLNGFIAIRDADLEAELRSDPQSVLPELMLRIRSGLPGLTMPSLARGGAPVTLFAVEECTLRLGEAIAVSMKVKLLPSLNQPAHNLGLPGGASWNGLVTELLSAFHDVEGTAVVEGTSLAITLDAPASAPSFVDLLKSMQTIAGTTASDPNARGKKTKTKLSKPLLDAKPKRLAFQISAPSTKPAELSMSASLECTIPGDTFDAALRFSIQDNIAEISLLAGMEDPIRLEIPAAPATALAAQLDQQADRVLQLYGAGPNTVMGQAVHAAADGLRAWFGADGADVLIAFEIFELGITLRLAPNQDPLQVTGGIRIVQYPPVLDLIFSGGSPGLLIGGGSSRVFVEFTPANAQGRTEPPPLVSLPVSEKGNLDVVLHYFRLAYVWATNEFEVALDVDVKAPNLPFHGGLGIKLPPNSTIELEVGTTVMPAGAPMLDVNLDFTGGVPQGRGFEVIVGPGPHDEDRAFTVYLRQFVLSPSFFLLMPGGIADFGLVIGKTANRTANDLYFEMNIGGATLITISPVIGLMLNPLAIIPPFITPNPPFWVVAPLLMGDLYTGPAGFHFAANVPLVLTCDVVLKRPMPSFTLGMLLEIVALVSSEFSVPIPAGSSLREMFYAEFTGTLTLPLLQAMFGKSNGSLQASLKFNVVDVANAFLDFTSQVKKMVEDSTKALDRGRQAFEAVLADPQLLVKMIPRPQRILHLSTTIHLLGIDFACDVAAHLMLPEEFDEEIELFLHSRRKRRKGIGGIREQGAAGTGILRPIDGLRSIEIPHNLASAGLGFLSQKAFDEMVDAVKAKLGKALEAKMNEARLKVPVTGNNPKYRVTAAFDVDSPDAVASKLVSDALAAPADRKAVTTRVKQSLGAAQKGRRPLLDSVDQSLTKLLSQRQSLPRTQFEKLRSDTVQDIANGIRQQAVVRAERDLPQTEFSSSALRIASDLLQFDNVMARPPRKTTTQTVKLIDVDAFVGLGRLKFPGGFTRPIVPAAAQTDQAKQFVIRPRAAFRALAPSYEVTVASLSAPFKVRFLGGKYILVSGARPIPGATELPSAFVNDVPLGPKRAASLTARLEVAQKVVSRPLTQKEKDYQATDVFDSTPTLYQESIFFADAYKLKPEGGTRGPLYLPDLLESSTSFRVLPSAPSLSLGLSLDLMAGRAAQFQVRFAGILSPPQKMLLFGYAKNTLEFAGPNSNVFKAKLEGELKIDVDGTQGSLSFNGHAVLLRNNTTLFEGAATGSLSSVSGKSKLSLTINTEVHAEASFHLDDVKILKGTVDGHAQLAVTLSDGLHLDAQVDVDLTLQTGAFQTVRRRVGVTVCDFSGNHCQFIGVTYDEPQFDEPMVWGPPQSISATLTAAVDSASGTVSFKIENPNLPNGRWELGGTLPS